MAEVPVQIIKLSKKFVEEALKDDIHISQAVLFGSYARGTYQKFSDIDLAVVSEDFTGSSFYDSKKLIKAMLRTSIEIEVHTYRPEDFTPTNPFVREILNNGIRIV